MFLSPAVDEISICEGIILFADCIKTLLATCNDLPPLVRQICLRNFHIRA
jgi:hypothetical protein